MAINYCGKMILVLWLTPPLEVFRQGIIRSMLGLTDNQLRAVMDIANGVPVEKRDLYLQRIAAMLTVRGRGHFNDADVADVARLALTGLAHQPAA